MGIVDLWKLISPSEKKYTLEEINNYTEKHQKGRGLRVAIDVALWVFQAKSSVVGDQSELRAIFFRFCRLYELGIRPVFVFDGPNRPEYKRNKFINTKPIETVFRQNLIQLIKHFNFSMWTAYGEAEAECALLERLGFVDMVFTADSDVFLFGARHVMRQWPAKRNEPVSCYDLTWVKDATGLDRSDLILIALLRGCDYDTNGTKGVGINVASQLAKCQFHRELMDDIQLAGRSQPLDDERVQHLFDNLTYELYNNGTRNLSRKHTGVVLDSKFFDFTVVTDFIHPVTNIGSDEPCILVAAKVLQNNLDHYHEPDWLNLAPFAQDSFNWPAEYLLKRFSSLLYHGYMASRLRRQQPNYTKPNRDHTTLLRNNNSLNNSQQQRTLQEFYRSTSRLHKPKEMNQYDLVQISSNKTTVDNLELYRVEWDRSSWETFQETLKLKLNFETFQDAIIIDDDNEQEETEMISEATTGGVDKNSKKEQDIWHLVKRQWIDATHIHHAYPSIALQYQNRKRKFKSSNSNNGSQTKMDSFLIIPPKRTSSSSFK